MEIIPAIDIINGECVRLSNGNYEQCKVYSKSPIDVAKKFEDLGFQRLHLVDLDGARSAHVVNYKVLEQIAAQTGLLVDFGGGIKSEADLNLVKNCGATYVTLGSIAVKDPLKVREWISQYGAEYFILGADCLDERIKINGWKETAETDVFSFINSYAQVGVKKFLCTDISRDGMLNGPSIDLYKKIMDKCSGCILIASGGVSSLEDLFRLLEIGIQHVIVGKAIYEGRINLAEIVNRFN